MAAKAGKTNEIKLEKKVGGAVTRHPGTLSDLGNLAGVNVPHTAHSPNQGNRQTQCRTEFSLWEPRRCDTWPEAGDTLPEDSVIG
jgi:hypothetical protein